MITAAIIAREIKLVKYGIGDLFLSLIGCILTICIFILIFDKYLIDPIVFYGVVLIITTLNIFTIDPLSDEFNSGIIEQLFLLPIPPFKIVLIKWVSLLSRYIIVNLLLWTIISHMVQVKFFYLQYILFTIYIVGLSFLITAISLSLPPKKQLVSHILLLPIIFPQIVLSILSVEDPIYIYLCLALSIIMVPLLILFTTIVLEGVVRDG